MGDFEWMTYSEAFKLAVEFGAGLVGMNLIPKKNDGMKSLALYSENRREWVLSMHATFCHGGTIVPIYSTFGDAELAYVLDQIEVTTIVCSSDKVNKVVECKKDCTSLKTVSLCDMLFMFLSNHYLTR